MAKMTKKERAAKAKAYASRFTEPMALDIWAMGGKLAHAGLRYQQTKDGEFFKNETMRDYLAFDPSTGEIDLGNLAKGWGGSINRAIEKKGFRMLGIKGPRSNLDTAGDIIDHLTYYMSTYFASKEGGDYRTRHRNAYHAQFGIDFYKDGLDAWQPHKMVEQKITPYVIQKFIRKVPIIKRTMAKLNKLF